MPFSFLIHLYTVEVVTLGEKIRCDDCTRDILEAVYPVRWFSSIPSLVGVL